MNGQYIVADPNICHGQPTFRGTRIIVSRVLKHVADGMDWDAIVEEYAGAISKKAIAEAVELACEAFEEKCEAALAP